MYSSAPKPPPATILLVDDEDLLRQVLAQALEDYGYRVLTAANGVEAWALLQAGDEPVHLVVTDVAMPQMDGLELAAQVATLPNPPPLIFISGYGRGEVPPDRPFLAKPLRPSQLESLVQQLLSDVNGGTSAPGIPDRSSPTGERFGRD